MSFKGSPGQTAKSRRRPIEDASESDDDISCDGMSDILREDTERGDYTIDEDGNLCWVVDDVLCKDDQGACLVKWKGFAIEESDWQPWENLDPATQQLWIEKEKRIQRNMVEKFDIKKWNIERARFEKKVEHCRRRKARREGASAGAESEESEEEALFETRKRETRERQLAQGMQQIERDIHGVRDIKLAGDTTKKKKTLVAGKKPPGSPSLDRTMSVNDGVPLKKRRPPTHEAATSTPKRGDATKISKIAPEKASPSKKRITPQELAKTTISRKSETRLATLSTAKPLERVTQQRVVSLPLKPNTNSPLSKDSNQKSPTVPKAGGKGPIAFKDKPTAKRRKPEDAQLFNSISHQYRSNRRATQDRIDSAESATVYKIVDGQRVIEQQPALPAGSESNPTMPDKPRPGIAISIPQPTANLAAASNKQHSKPPGFIPLTCPFWYEKKPCQRLSSCFFQHALTDPLRCADYDLFRQAEEESTYPGRNVYKFGFFPDGEAVTCKFWPGCTQTDAGCWHAHWPTSTRALSPTSGYPQPSILAPLICWYWANGRKTGRPCFKSARDCNYLHEMREGCQVAPQPKNRQGAFKFSGEQLSPWHQVSNSTKDPQLPAISSEGLPPDEGVPMEIDTDGGDLPIQDTTLPESTVASPPRVDLPLTLEVQGMTFDVTINVPLDAVGLLKEKSRLQLERGILAEHFEDFFDFSEPLCFGPVACNAEHFNVLVHTLRSNLQGAAIPLPSVDLLFIPTGLDSWSFLPSSTDNGVLLKCYVYKKGLWPASVLPKNVEGNRNLEIFDILERIIPGGHKIFFEWIGKQLSPNVFLADTGDDWNNDKELWTRFFREAGSTVYHDYDTFKTETKSGVFVLPPTLDLSILRTTNSVRDLLLKSYNFFYLGFDRGAFACEKLFSRGSTILLTFGTYKNHPEDAIAIINNLQERINTEDESQRVTWKLAGPPNLVGRLATLLQDHKGKKEYRRLLYAVVELQEHVDPTGAMRAFVELGDDDDDYDTGTDTDTGDADAAAVESLAVWAYGHDEGALVNRRCVVVYDDGAEASSTASAVPVPASAASPSSSVAGSGGGGGGGAEAESVRRWRADFQNLCFMPPRDYLSLFLRIAVPGGAASSALVTPVTPANLCPPIL